MTGSCEAAKPGPGNTTRTPCGKDENAENCRKCPFWVGPRGTYMLGRRGGVETPTDSRKFRLISAFLGTLPGDS